MNQSVAQLNTPNSDSESGADNKTDPIDARNDKTRKNNRFSIPSITKMTFIGPTKLALIVFLALGSIGAGAIIKPYLFDDPIVDISTDEPTIENVSMDDFSVLRDTVNRLELNLGEVLPKILTLEKSSGSMDERIRASEIEKLKIRKSLSDVRKSIKNMLERYKRYDEQVSLLRKKAKPIKRKITPIKFKFVIDGLGSWNGSPVLTISYQGSYLMIEKGESIDGWWLNSLDADAGKAEFVHRSGKTVQVNV